MNKWLKSTKTWGKQLLLAWSLEAPRKTWSWSKHACPVYCGAARLLWPLRLESTLVRLTWISWSNPKCPNHWWKPTYDPQLPTRKPLSTHTAAITRATRMFLALHLSAFWILAHLTSLFYSEFFESYENDFYKYVSNDPMLKIKNFRFDLLHISNYTVMPSFLHIFFP